MMGEYDAGYENCIDAMVRQMEDMQFRIDSLHRENAKLRELVEDMLDCIEIRAAFGRPPTEEMYETFAQRTRELGVEVDE